MRITPDTNLLVRIAVRDDRKQGSQALKAVKQAEVVALSTVALCEMVWVLRGVYKFSQNEVLEAIALLINAPNVIVDRVAVEAGIKVLENGGDFADGTIATEGVRLGGETFVSFDKGAVSKITALGRPTKLLS